MDDTKATKSEHNVVNVLRLLTEGDVERVTNSDHEYQGRCPIHKSDCVIKAEDEKHLWKCDSGSSGDVITLLMEVMRYSYSEAMDQYPDMPHNPNVIYRHGDVVCSNKGICVTPTRLGAHRLAEIDVVATSIHEWKSSYAKAFQDRAIILLPDNSKPGRGFMGQLAGHIARTAVSLQMVHIPDLDPAEGIESWLSHGGTKEQLAKLINATEFWQTEAAPATDIHSKEPIIDPPPEWNGFLLRKPNGMLETGSFENCCVYLEHEKTWKGRLKYNEFACEVEIDGRPVEDNDDAKVCRWMERKGLKLKPTAMRAAINTVATQHTYNPLQDYLRSLEWDGEPRLNTWLSKYLGCDTTPYTEMIARKFLIGAVARGLQPGCKMDYMLILEGDQGIKKSTAIEALFSPAWFTDELADLGSKDAGLQIQGVWCVEMAELSSLSRSAANRTKEWITRRRDRFRPPYARSLIISPRSCVLMGTVNPEGGYLKDSTGGRRFWPVQCHNITVKDIRENRDQLWAEAKYAYDNQEQWWLESGDQTALAEYEQEMRYEGDPWEQTISNFV